LFFKFKSDFWIPVFVVFPSYVHIVFQTSTKRAVETTDITRSFGWDSSDGSNESCEIRLFEILIMIISSHVFRFFSLCLPMRLCVCSVLLFFVVSMLMV